MSNLNNVKYRIIPIFQYCSADRGFGFNEEVALSNTALTFDLLNHPVTNPNNPAYNHFVANLVYSSTPLSTYALFNAAPPICN